MNYGIMSSAEMKQCIKISSDAFDDYEFFSAYFPCKVRRKLFLRSMLTTEFKVNKEHAIFLTAKEDNNIAAVAILCAPDGAKPTGEDYLKNGFWKALVCGGYRNAIAWLEMNDAAGKPCHAIEDSWYLSMLVVHPNTKGKGVGSVMIQDCIIPYVKQHGGKSISLFTNSEINRRFYQKNGFSEFDERSFAHEGKTIGSWSYIMHI